MGPTTPPTKKLHRVWPWPRGDCVRSSVDVDDGATSSTGLGLRRTRLPGPPVGGQERFFGGERHPTLTAPRASLPVMARRFRPDLREIGLFEGLDASSWPRRRDLRPPGGLGLGRTRPPRGTRSFPAISPASSCTTSGLRGTRRRASRAATVVPVGRSRASARAQRGKNCGNGAGDAPYPATGSTPAPNYKPHPITGSRVVLTTAHVHDKRPVASSLLNLAALCQRCHNTHDLEDRRRNARERNYRDQRRLF